MDIMVKLSVMVGAIAVLQMVKRQLRIEIYLVKRQIRCTSS